MSVHVRLATVDDAESMDALNRTEMPENYPIDVWRTILSDYWSSSFVAHNDDGELIGYILTIGEYNFYNFSRQAHVASLTVKEKYRCHGVGTTLLKTSLDRVKNYYNIRCCHLNVRVDNDIAK